MTKNIIQPHIKWLIIIIVSLIVINTLWLNILYRHQLFLMSLDFIINYQQNGNQFTKFVYNIFSLISGTQVTVAILIILVILTFRKANTFVLIFYVALNTYIMAIAKISFIDPRPSWYTDQIHQLQWKCEYTYGFPSGHCWIILILHEIIFCDVIGAGPYHLFLLEPLILSVFVPLSRLYLGSHSGDHIVSSITYGFAFALFYKYAIQKLIFNLFSFILNVKKRTLTFFIIFFFQLLMMAPPVILYEVNTTQNRLGYFFLMRLNTICSDNYTLKQIEGRQASQSAIGNAVMGILYSLLLFTTDVFQSNNRKLRVRYWLTGKWNFGQQKVKNIILALIVYIIPAAVILVVFFILIPHFVDNFYGDYCSMTIAWTLVVIYWLRFVPQIAFMFKLIEENSQQDTIVQQIRIQQNDYHGADNGDSEDKYVKGASINIKAKVQKINI